MNHFSSDDNIPRLLRDRARDNPDHVYCRSDAGPLTYAGLGVFRPRLLDGWRAHTGDAGADETPPRFRLALILRAHMAAGRITGEHYRGRWTDVGTPDRLAVLDAEFSAAR